MRAYNGRRTPSLASRLWSKVTFGPGCWTWTRATDGHGYGVIGLPGGGVDKAHRVAYRLAKGPIHEGLDILHSCDNPPCVRPEHLSPGTAGDNMRDCVRKGRHFTPFSLAAFRRPHPKNATCRRGHLYDEANTAFEADGSRRCRACSRENSARSRSRMAVAS